jgi:hypothetical protein
VASTKVIKTTTDIQPSATMCILYCEIRYQLVEFCVIMG